MSKFNKARDEWNKLSEDDKISVAVAAVIGTFVLLMLLVLIVALIKELFVPALIAVAVYLLGARYFGWPVPKKLKQFFIK